MFTNSVLEGIRVASPCSMSWDGMAGNERARFCSACRQHVFNLSEMTKQDAEALIREKNGKLCVRYYQRSDGSVMTRDCRAVVFSRLRGGLLLMAGLVVILLIAVVGWSALRIEDDKRGGSLLDRQPFRAILEWFNPPRPWPPGWIEGGVVIRARQLPNHGG